MQSGNTYRMSPDGSHAEYVTHGQVNPFGLAFDPMGNLYSCDCHSRPVYQLIRGAWYPSFGKPDDGLGFGPDMVTHDHGSTGIAGISYYAADQFPEAYRGTVFIGNVVTNRINHDRIEWHGTTPKGIEQPDFVWSEDNWFRPVDIELGPDGALYIADFYNRIIGHYEVPLTHPGRDRDERTDLADRLPRRGRQAAAGPVDHRSDPVVGAGADRRPRPSQPGGATLRGQPARRARRQGRRGGGPRGHDEGRAGPSPRARPVGPATARSPRRRHPDGMPARPRSRAEGPRPQDLDRACGMDPVAARLRPAGHPRPRPIRAPCRRRGIRRAPGPFSIQPAADAPPGDAGRRYPPDPRRPHRPAGPVEDGRDLARAGRARPLRSRPEGHRRRRHRRPHPGVGGLPGGLPEGQDESPENWVRYVHHIARYAAPERIDRLAELVRKAGAHGGRLAGPARQGDPPGVAGAGHAARRGDARDGRRACAAAAGLEGWRRDRPGHRAGQRPAAPRGPAEAARAVGTRLRGASAAVGRADGPGGDRPDRQRGPVEGCPAGRLGPDGTPRIGRGICSRRAVARRRGAS